MKHGKRNWSDVYMLLVAVLAIMAFLRGKAQSIAFIAVFALWGTVAVFRHLIPYIKVRKACAEAERLHKYYEKREQKQKPVWDLEVSDTVSTVLLRHVSHRISSYLQATYPEATWSWCDRAPEKVISGGGTAKIKLNGIPDFDYAEVAFDQNANIGVQLINVVPLGAKNDEAKHSEKLGVSKPFNEVNPQVWYEQEGKKVLTGLIADISSRGYSTLTIEESGDIAIMQGETAVKKPAFRSLPNKAVWPRLAKVIEGSGVATEVTDGGLVLTW